MTDIQGIPALTFITSAISSFFRLAWIVFFTIPGAIWQLIWFVLVNTHWIILIVLLYSAGVFWLPTHKPLAESLEFAYRCKIHPIWQNFLEPLFASVVDAYNKLVCWWNAWGQFTRLFTFSLMFRVLRNCPNGFDFYDLMRAVANTVFVLVSRLAEWLFVFNFIENVLPSVPFLAAVQETIGQVQLGLTCLCQDLRPVWQYVERVLRSKNLKCGLHAFLNFVVVYAQGLIEFWRDFIVLLFELIFQKQDVSVIVDILRGTGPLKLWDITVPAERANQFAHHVGEYGDDIVQTLICTIRSEIEAEGDALAVPAKYAACLNDTRTRVPIVLFTVIGPLVSAVSRWLVAIFRLVANIGRIFFEFSFIGTNKPRYIIDVWSMDPVWDSIRRPPLRFNYSVSLNNPSIKVGSNISTLDLIPSPNPLVFPNLTFPVTNISCDLANVSSFQIICDECDIVSQVTLEEAIREFCIYFDDFIEPEIDGRPLESLCCLIVTLGRAWVQFLRELWRLISFLFAIDRIGDWFTDQNVFGVFFTELLGRPTEFGGFLECCELFLGAFDDRLKCVCRLLTLPVKVIGEFLRYIIVLIIRLFNDIWQTGEPGILDYVCVEGANCWDVEGTMASFLRRPRLKNFTVDHEYIPVSGDLLALDTWIDCVCFFISLEFINLFLDDPISIPDFCCGVEFLLRAIVEILKMAIEIWLLVWDSLTVLIRGTKPGHLQFLDYFACENEFLCSPIPEIVSDIQDWITCPCTIIEDIDELLGPGEDIPCICIILDEGALILTDILRGVAIGAGGLVKAFACIIEPFPDNAAADCTTGLGERFSNVFVKLLSVLDRIAAVFGGGGCLFGLIFDFDCVGTPRAVLPDSPPCGGSGICTPSNRFTDLFEDGANVVLIIVRIPLIIFRDVTLVAFGGNATTGLVDLFSFSGFINSTLQEFGVPLFGELDVNGTLVRTGLLQSLALMVNCIVGPGGNTTCATSLTGNNAGCVGDIFWDFGLLFGEFYSLFVDILVNGVKLLETLFTNPSNLGNVIVDFVEAVWAFFLGIFTNIATILDLIVGFFVAIASLIDPGFGAVVDAILGFFVTAIQTIIDLVVAFLGLIGVPVPKRSDFGYSVNIVPDYILKNYPGLTDETVQKFMNAETMLENTTANTYCYRVFYHLKDKSSFYEMSLAEELIWKGCFFAYSYPYMSNARKDALFQLPLDIFYNTDTFLATARDILLTFKLYLDYRGQNLLATPAFQNSSQVIAGAFVDLDPIPNSPIDSDAKRSLNENVDPNDEATSILLMNPTDPSSIPVVNKECPHVYAKMSFKQILHAKGIHCKIAEDLIEAFESQQKRGLEQKFLKLAGLSSFIKWEKNTSQSVGVPTSIPEKEFTLPIPSLRRTAVSIATKISNNIGEYIDNSYQKKATMQAKLFEEKTEHLRAKERRRITETSDLSDTTHSLTWSMHEVIHKWKTTKAPIPTFSSLSEWFHRTQNALYDLPSTWAQKREEKRKDKEARLTEKRFIYALSESDLHGEKFYYNDTGDINTIPSHINTDSIYYRYRHVLKGQTLIGHRIGLLKQVFQKIATEHSHKIIHRLLPSIAKPHLEYYRHHHTNALKKGRLPTLTRLYSTYHRIRNTSPYLHYVMPRVPEKIHNWLIYPNGEQSTSPFTTSEHVRYSKILHQHSLETYENVPFHTQKVTDLCIVDETTVCSACTSCENNTCTGCTACTNCTRNPRACEFCACTTGGNCTDCDVCTDCTTTGFCFDCQIIEVLLNDVVDIFSFCANKFRGFPVVWQPPPNFSKVARVEIGQSNITFGTDTVSQFLVDTINDVAGFDLFATAFEFLINTNVNPRGGTVGLTYFVLRLPIPYVSRCNRDIDLQCVFGMGFERGVIVAIVLSFILSVGLWFVSPEFAGVVGSIVSFLGGWTVLFIFFTVSFSWGYNPVCWSFSSASLISLVFDAPVTPMVPECAAEELFNWVSDLLQRCLWTSTALTTNNITCPACDIKLSLVDCRAFGFTGTIPQISYFLQSQLPSFSSYMRSTCLVKGSCILGLTSSPGMLEPLFNTTFTVNITAPVLNACSLWMKPVLFAGVTPVFFVILFLIYFGPTITAILQWLWMFITSPPFVFIIPGYRSADQNEDDPDDDGGGIARQRRRPPQRPKQRKPKQKPKQKTKQKTPQQQRRGKPSPGTQRGARTPQSARAEISDNTEHTDSNASIWFENEFDAMGYNDEYSGENSNDDNGGDDASPCKNYERTTSSPGMSHRHSLHFSQSGAIVNDRGDIVPIFEQQRAPGPIQFIHNLITSMLQRMDKRKVKQ